MKNKYPIKYVARAILRNGEEVQYFSSPAFIKQVVRDPDGCVKFVIEYCELYGDERVEDYPYSTGYYYGEIFESKSLCDRYVEDLNIRFPYLNKRELKALKDIKRMQKEQSPE